MAITLPKPAGCILPNIQGLESAGGGGGAAANDDFTRVDVTDGTWTKHDYQTSGSSIGNVGGVNSVTLSTAASTTYVNGVVWYKELKTGDGSDFDFTDKKVALDFYMHFPETGWSDNSSPPTTGGLNNPPTASKCGCLIGVMTDPENLPTSGSGPWPRDMLAAGLEWKTLTSRMYRTFLRNTSNSGTYGAASVSAAGLDTITASDLAAGHKACNRLEWSTYISKAEHWAAGALDPAGGPDSYYSAWADRYDNGDRRTIGNYSSSQRWGRTRTNKLYVFVVAGRQSGAGSSVTLKFDAYYNITILDGGNNPSGKTGL